MEDKIYCYANFHCHATFLLFSDQFLGGESFRGGDKLLQGEPPWKKPVLNALIYTSSGYGFFRGFQLMFLKHADVLNPQNLNEGNQGLLV